MINDNLPGLDRDEINQKRLDDALAQVERTALEVTASAAAFRIEVGKVERALRFLRYVLLASGMVVLGFLIVGLF